MSLCPIHLAASKAMQVWLTLHQQRRKLACGSWVGGIGQMSMLPHPQVTIAKTLVERCRRKTWGWRRLRSSLQRRIYVFFCASTGAICMAEWGLQGHCFEVASFLPSRQHAIHDQAYRFHKQNFWYIAQNLAQFLKILPYAHQVWTSVTWPLKPHLKVANRIEPMIPTYP